MPISDEIRSPTGIKLLEPGASLAELIFQGERWIDYSKFHVGQLSRPNSDHLPRSCSGQSVRSSAMDKSCCNSMHRCLFFLSPR